MIAFFLQWNSKKLKLSVRFFFGYYWKFGNFSQLLLVVKKMRKPDKKIKKEHWRRQLFMLNHNWIKRQNKSTKMFKNSKFYLFKINFVQKWIKITFRSQRSPEKSFLVISEHFWTKIEFWKKKSQNFARITQKRVIFEISIVGFWSGSADNRPICYERVRLGRKSSQNVFWDYISKIHDFIQKS